jgi:periplasmic copper chaperone A
MLRQTKASLALAALVMTVGATAVRAEAHEFKSGALVIHHPWTRATPAGARVAGGFAVIDNKGAEPDRLVGASLSRADRSEIHEMATEGGVMTMKAVAGGLEIPAGGSVTLAPGGYHLMFPGLKAQLRQGETVAGTLSFEKAGTVPVEFSVEAIAARGDDHAHTD